MMARGRLASGRGVWLALMLIPVAAWLGLAALALSYSSPEQHTGDKLLDRYCDAILSRRLVGGFDIAWGMPENLFFADAELAGWEAEFGGDPRLWMLRYHVTTEASIPVESASYAVEIGLNRYYAIRPRVYYLEEARRRGIADSAVLLSLLRQYEAAWQEATARDVTVPKPARNQDPAAYVQARSAALDARFGEEHAQLLDELLAVADEQALPHYYAALYATERGDYVGALDELARGNRAPRNTALWGFPYDDLLGRMRDGGRLPDKAAGGSICLDTIMLSLPNYIRFKAMNSMLLADAVEREDLAALEELHRFGCRFGDATGNEQIGALVGCVLIQKVWETANNWPQPLTGEQQQALVELKQKSDKLKNELKSISGSTNWPYSMPAIMQMSRMERTEFILTGGRSLSLQQLESLHDNRLAEQQALGGKIHQLFKEIESFDYGTLSWEKE